MQLLKKIYSSYPCEPIPVLLSLWAWLVLLWLVLPYFVLLPLSNAYADDETGLGYSSGLNGEVDNGATTLPSGTVSTIPDSVRPVIVLPPESLQPHTLVVPLPGEQASPLILRRNSIEVLPSIHPALPRSRISNGGAMQPPPPPVQAEKPMPAKSKLAKPDLSKSKRNKSGKYAPAPAADVPTTPDAQQGQARGSVIKTTPLEPIVY